MNDNKSEGVAFQKRHCRWPYQNVFQGSGNPNYETSWECVWLNAARARWEICIDYLEVAIVGYLVIRTLSNMPRDQVHELVQESYLLTIVRIVKHCGTQVIRSETRCKLVKP